jgi:hypothetical protein
MISTIPLPLKLSVVNDFTYTIKKSEAEGTAPFG